MVSLNSKHPSMTKDIITSITNINNSLFSEMQTDCLSNFLVSMYLYTTKIQSYYQAGKEQPATLYTTMTKCNDSIKPDVKTQNLCVYNNIQKQNNHDGINMSNLPLEHSCCFASDLHAVRVPTPTDCMHLSIDQILVQQAMAMEKFHVVKNKV